jgi:AmmeMemoRadiSam system protein B
LVPDEAVLITSVDFSHYVSSKVAEEQDRVTIQALELERPTDKTAMRTDANEVLIVLKEWARLRGADEFQLQARADAGDFGEVDDPENITSYATFYYVNGID